MYPLFKKQSLILCLTISISPMLLAQEVKMFDEGKVPTAEEMADIMSSTTSEKSSKKTPDDIKFRSISFGLPKKKTPMRMGLPIKFDFDSSILKKRSIVYLIEFGTMLNLEKMANEKFMIEGHTDTSGSADYNMNLSKKRSQTVKNFLISNYKIDPARLQIIGKGESAPLPNTKGNDPMNRRVQFFQIP